MAYQCWLTEKVLQTVVRDPFLPSHTSLTSHDALKYVDSIPGLAGKTEILDDVPQEKWSIGLRLRIYPSLNSILLDLRLVVGVKKPVHLI